MDSTAPDSEVGDKTQTSLHHCDRPVYVGETGNVCRRCTPAETHSTTHAVNRSVVKCSPTGHTVTTYRAIFSPGCYVLGARTEGDSNGLNPVGVSNKVLDTPTKENVHTTII